MVSYKKLESKCHNLEDNVASAILFTHSPQATPTSFLRLFPSRGERSTREGKSPGNEVEAHSKGNKNMSFTRKIFRILTKIILTCLFEKRGGEGVQHFGSE